MDQAVLVRANSGLDATIDELRITTSFAEAVPVPEPTAVGILLSAASLLSMRRRASR